MRRRRVQCIILVFIGLFRSFSFYISFFLYLSFFLFFPLFWSKNSKYPFPLYIILMDFSLSNSYLFAIFFLHVTTLFNKLLIFPLLLFLSIFWYLFLLLLSLYPCHSFSLRLNIFSSFPNSIWYTYIVSKKVFLLIQNFNHTVTYLHKCWTHTDKKRNSNFPHI